MIHHPLRPQDRCQRQCQVGGDHSIAQRADEFDAKNARRENEEGLTEHHRFRFDAADAPAEHAESVDHRRVRIGADDRIGEQFARAREYALREVFEMDLVNDAGCRWDDAHILERLRAPAQKFVSLAIPLEFELRVLTRRIRRAKDIHVQRMVNHQIRRHARIDRARVPAKPMDRLAHRGKVNQARQAGEILHQDPRG